MRIRRRMRQAARDNPGEHQFSPWRCRNVAACSRQSLTKLARHVPQWRNAMSRMKPEDVIAGKNRPFTGTEYLESLRDGREVYIYGERVEDVSKHPAFR